MDFAKLVYILTCICFALILGAGIYEHVAVWPSTFSAPPRSLTLFQGPYQLNSGPFWRLIHPVTLLLFIVTLVAHWSSGRRGYILTPLVVYVVILASTFLYFVPELVRITSTPYSEMVNAALQRRGSLWITLSLIRAVIILGVLIILCWGLTVSAPSQR